MRRGVDTDLFHPLRRTAEDGIFRLGFVGRLVAEKNLRLLAEVEREIIRSGHTNYRFVIVGDGSERPWLEKNLRRAEFTGVLRGEELARAYANMDLFLFPSRSDAFGNVVQEALASGTPALVTRAGGPKHLVTPGVTGYVEETDREFIHRAAALVANPADLRRMRVAARQAARTASWEQVFGEVWAAYEFCLRLYPPSAALVREPAVEHETVA
jgi:glycosyltransferase involved in cell wall biosynthesis